MEEKQLNESDTSNYLRMSRKSFDDLALMLRDHLLVDESYAARRGGAISPEYCLFMTLRYLAGARYQDICNTCRFQVQQCMMPLKEQWMQLSFVLNLD